MVAVLALVLALQPADPPPAIVLGAAAPAGEAAFDLVVVVSGQPGAVVAHVSVPGETAARVVPMAPSGDGRWTARVPVEPQRAIGVVFEALFPDGSAEASGPIALAELGMPPEAFPSPATTVPPAVGGRQPVWIWIGAAAAAAAVLVLGGLIAGTGREATG